MAHYRLPGPMCSWSQNLVVDDGTSALSPGCRPGPIVGAVPGHASEFDPRTLWRRASGVQEACRIGLIRAPEAIVRATGLDDLPALAKGILEGVLGMLAVVGASAALGGAVGGAIGALAGGIGAVPGAALGGQFGMDAGVAVLGWLGLGFLAVAVGRGLMEVSGKVSHAVGQAWDAEGRSRRSEEIEAAGQLLADAVGKLMLLIVMAVVARLAAAQVVGATAKAGGTAEELYAALRQSRLGAGFAEWVKANEQRLLSNPRLRMHNVVGGTGGKSVERVTPSQLKQLREASPAAAPVPQSRSGGSGNLANGDAIKKSGLENANFAQNTFSSKFSKGGAFEGRSVDDVAAALRSKAMKPSEVPIDFIVRDGNTLILNTRSAQALEAAGIPRSQWSAVNRSGEELYENMLSGQLQRNGLTSEGIVSVRRTGAP